MTTTQLQTVRTDLSHAICEIQSEWSARERSRRHRLAELRQRRLARMVSPRPRVEAYDCQCDMGDAFEPFDEGEGHEEHRARRYVLIED